MMPKLTPAIILNKIAGINKLFKGCLLFIFCIKKRINRIIIIFIIIGRVLVILYRMLRQYVVRNLSKKTHQSYNLQQKIVN